MMGECESPQETLFRALGLHICYSDRLVVISIHSYRRNRAVVIRGVFLHLYVGPHDSVVGASVLADLEVIIMSNIATAVFYIHQEGKLSTVCC